jgi:stress-induced morphogen
MSCKPHIGKHHQCNTHQIQFCINSSQRQFSTNNGNNLPTQQQHQQSQQRPTGLDIGSNDELGITTIMTQKLTKEFQPTHLQVSDISGGCGAFFNIVCVSPQFEGTKKLANHRKITALLKDEIRQLHGFTVETFSPSQWMDEQRLKEQRIKDEEIRRQRKQKSDRKWNRIQNNSSQQQQQGNNNSQTNNTSNNNDPQ